MRGGTLAGLSNYSLRLLRQLLRGLQNLPCLAWVLKGAHPLPKAKGSGDCAGKAGPRADEQNLQSRAGSQSTCQAGVRLG